jgi:hypothetical protein
LWEGRHDQAATAVAEGLGWIAEQDPKGVPAQLSCLCYAPALRLEADRPSWRPPEDGTTALPRPASGPHPSSPRWTD